MKPKVLVTDPVHDLLISGLEEMGFEVVYRPEIKYNEALGVVGAYEGIIINSKIKAGVQLIDAGQRLKFIGRLGSGLDVIDEGYATEKNIRYFNTPEANCDAVAEHALGMLLSLLNNICHANNELHHGNWSREPNRGTELGGKTVGIIGYGNTGRAFAQRLQGFNVQVLAYDKYIGGFGKGHVQEATLQTLFDEADFLSLHTQLTDETRYMVNADFLKRFRKPFYLMNTSRGQVVRTADLLEAVSHGIVLGAALDVLENEKPDTYSEDEQKLFERLTREPRILLTPHIAGWTRESKQKIAESVLCKVRNLNIV